MNPADRSLDELCVNTIRALAIDMVEEANSGHPGLPLGAAPMAHVLWQYHLRHDPEDPSWPDRDRFVLSAGHGSALLYALLCLAGYDLTLDDLRAFRQWGSRTPGHPERGHTPGVEVTTGPLGQGTGNAVGMALAERHLAQRFNRAGHTVVDHYTYALVSDGDLMEGVTAEASSLAGHLQLGKLIFLYDSNHVSLDGPTSLAFTEDVAARYLSYGWQVLEVADGDHDLVGLDRALDEARAESRRPSLIIVHSTIGYGSPNKAGTAAVHGSPLGRDEVVQTKLALGWKEQGVFAIPDLARQHFRKAQLRGGEQHQAWRKRFETYAREHPELAAAWESAMTGRLPEGWDSSLPHWKPGEKAATRVAAGKALASIASRVPWLLGGDADLSSSTKTAIKEGGSFEGLTGKGRNIHFGVREHAMGAIANGIAAHGGVRPYVSTFLCFSDYMRPAVRLAAMGRLPVIYVWTHDSVGVGEDGPTHQPVEHLAALRVIPGLVVVRPADPNEAVEAWRWAITYREGPVALVLSRQDLPVLESSGKGRASLLPRGAYVLHDSGGKPPDAILIASGSEVAVAAAARELLGGSGIAARVVSMPSWELFEAQDSTYREAVLPAAVRVRVSVEAGVSFGWSRWTGEKGVAIGIDRFGASAPGETVMAELGITAEHVADTVRRLLQRA
ncbi:MAG: transketolase [Planctomycetota bacterium]